MKKDVSSLDVHDFDATVVQQRGETFEVVSCINVEGISLLGNESLVSPADNVNAVIEIQKCLCHLTRFPKARMGT